MKNIISLYGISLIERHAARFQLMFTQYGAQPRLRLGWHDGMCPANGLIRQEMTDSTDSDEMAGRVGDM